MLERCPMAEIIHPIYESAPGMLPNDKQPA
jgi:hypothetical protein